jgi:signal peptidase
VSSAGSRAAKVFDSLKGVIMALVVVAVIILGLWAYSGIWPPLVVIESPSMQHSSTVSYIGVIDTGDLVIVKKVSGAESVRPYLESMPSGYRTYSEYGDVVIYHPLGNTLITPIIHRALCWVDYNATGGGYDVPGLRNVPSSMWEVSSGPKTWYNINSALTLNGIGYNSVSVTIDFAIIKSHSGASPQGGFITLGDNNHGIVDQMTSICPQPVRGEWLEGVARGEVPWFGLLKLWISGPAPASVPENSKNNLFISLALIIGVPIALDVTALVLERKGIDFWGKVRKVLGMKPKAKKEDEDLKEKKGEPDPKASSPHTKKGGDKKKTESPPRKSSQKGKRK